MLRAPFGPIVCCSSWKLRIIDGPETDKFFNGFLSRKFLATGGVAELKPHGVVKVADGAGTAATAAVTLETLLVAALLSFMLVVLLILSRTDRRLAG